VRISPPDGGSPIFVKAELTTGLMTRGGPLEQAVARSSAATRAKSQALSEHDLEEPLLPPEARKEEEISHPQANIPSLNHNNPEDVCLFSVLSSLLSNVYGRSSPPPWKTSPM